MCNILDHILQISFSNSALVKWNLASVKWQELLYKTLLKEKKSKENIIRSKEMWKVSDMNNSLGYTLFSLTKCCCNRNGGNDILDYIGIVNDQNGFQVAF